ncbi:MAG TPA: helix-turn-helix domain-containing protein [Solirubrobacteraceae bacterium]|nr:helix-turn-helix domain-containing protein [Solirubrobacteraceae bacterium]
MSAEIQMSGKLAPREAWGAPGDSCPIARTFETLGTKTAYVLMREAFYGATRFEEFVERTGISEPVAAARLRELTAHGLLEKVPYREPGQRTRHEYRLTAKGEDLLPVLVAMMRWGDRWLFPNGARVELTHAGCGGRVHAALECEHDHHVAPDELQLGSRGR